MLRTASVKSLVYVLFDCGERAVKAPGTLVEIWLPIDVTGFLIGSRFSILNCVVMD